MRVFITVLLPALCVACGWQNVRLGMVCDLGAVASVTFTVPVRACEECAGIGKYIFVVPDGVGGRGSTTCYGYDDEPACHYNASSPGFLSL